VLATGLPALDLRGRLPDLGLPFIGADNDEVTKMAFDHLRQRGLLDETLIVWSAEFGRTPFAQADKGKLTANAGRDHHRSAYTVWMAGGGVKGGTSYGETDEVGYHAAIDRTSVHDVHATILHLMGLDHERLTYHFSGRNFRLTDVAGKVIDKVIA
jgi:arylsulfatase A-like enzyme